MTGIGQLLGRVSPADSYLLVTCNACQHEFIAIYFPQPAGLCARMMKQMFCPMCGNMKLLMSDHTRTIKIKKAARRAAAAGV